MWRAAPLALLFVLAACSYAPPGTAQGNLMLSVWQLFVYAGIAVYVIVGALIVWSAFAYRRRDPSIVQSPSTKHKNPALEITWTIIPVLIVAGLFVRTYIVEAKVEAVTPNPTEVVNVLGYRWSWRFDYPRRHVSIDGSPHSSPTLVLPVNETIRFNLTSNDVIHSFWVPGFLFKRDANPGMINVFDLKPTRTGSYLGRCAEYCGTYHSIMGFTVRVVSPSEYASWIRGHGGTI